jgi:DNA-binding NarL/FixJ family response regulator
VGEEKKRVHEQVAAQIERSVLPLLDRLKSRSQESDRKILQIIEENLQEATAGQEKRFSYKMNRLTQKEIEISDMIKRGMSCKEIGSLLNISFRTVETHRNRIRKKLGITDPGINLATMLRNM